MSLTIDASDILQRRSLTVTERGVRLASGLFGRGRRVRFEEIGWVVMGGDLTLHIQWGGEVFSIATRVSKKKHREVIAALVERLELTDPRPPSPAAAP